jgi:hypothetical protein
VSDLFKDHKPELSEEEDRLLWQRVRAIPAPAPHTAPWWERLWAMPTVRYGAPALAVMLAAVVWVIEREPDYKPAASRGRQEAPFVVQSSPSSPAPPVPTRNSARVTAVDEKAASKLDAGREAAKDQAGGAEWRADEVAPSEDQRKEETAQSAAPTALRKSAPAAAPTFAPPPAEIESRERKQVAAPAPQAATVRPMDSKVAGRAEDQPQWGAVKNGYRDSGNSAQLERMLLITAPDMLVQGSLPDPSMLATHAVVQAASPTAYARAAAIPLPIDIATQADLKKAGAYEDLAPAEQAAAIAYAFERALANPAATPRARIERMLAHARAIQDRAGKADKAGASKLVAMIEGALQAWP